MSDSGEIKKPKFNRHRERVPGTNDSFCMAPFTHTFISPQSERRICCASREQPAFVRQYIDKGGASSEEYAPVPLKEHWNSDFMKGIRAKMLRGEKVKECEVCNDQILNLSTYKSWFTNHLFFDKIDEAFEKTLPDGTSLQPAISFDYRIHNTCNFKCRMCGHQLSSAWEQELRINNAWSAESDPWMESGMNAKIRDFQTSQVQGELMEAVKNGTVEEIYWVGGEPLMWNFHWEAMEASRDAGHSRKVYCRYNTNLSKIVWKKSHLFEDILPHFKEYLMCCSLDGVGEIGEWIRTGLKWEEWVKNFESGLAVPKKRDAMKLDLTLTLPGLFSMKEYLDFAIKHDVEIYTKLVFAFSPDKVISPMALPRPLLEEVVKDLLAYIEPRAGRKQKTLPELLRNLLARKTFEEEWPERYQEGMQKGKAWMQKVASWRKDGTTGAAMTFEDILGNHPEVLKWYERIEAK